jgi:pyruvate dehydrogenase E1 component alpha subunit
MHIADMNLNILGANGIVGASMPLSSGAALAAKLRGSGQVVIAFFGDGTSNQGVFHEAMNLASVWKLPLIFVCENNQYALTTSFRQTTSVEQIAQRAAGYSMPGVTVDGNDPLAMYRAASVAVDRARAGEGPTLLEATTFRFFGHVFGDADAYMDPGEKDAAMAKDPVPLFRAWLIAAGHAAESELADMEAAIEREIDAAIEFTLNSPFPDVAELRRDVFKDEEEMSAPTLTSFAAPQGGAGLPWGGPAGDLA